MNIPTEFYEEEFIEFENYMDFTGNKMIATPENPHANSNYYLQMYKKYEKFVQVENKKIFKKRTNDLRQKKDHSKHMQEKGMTAKHNKEMKVQDRGSKKNKQVMC